jgi:zinc protease
VPNNVALVIAGDFDPAQARQWVQKYFGEFPRGGPIPPLDPRPAALAGTKRLLHEDNFARLPELTMVWPSVPALHPDSYALGVLFDLLTDGKKAPLTPCWSTSSTSPTASPPRDTTRSSPARAT